MAESSTIYSLRGLDPRESLLRMRGKQTRNGVETLYRKFGNRLVALLRLGLYLLVKICFQHQYAADT